jgi:hypothetical protein
LGDGFRLTAERSVRLKSGKDREEHRAFEQEFFRVGRATKAVEQSLDAVAREHEVERLLATLAQREQPLPDGSRQIPLRSGLHVRLSK